MEVEEAVVSLDILDAKLDLSVREGLVFIQVGKAQFENSSLQSFGSDLRTRGLRDERSAAVLRSEDRWSNQLVPFFLQKRVDRLFAASLLALRQTLIFSLFSWKVHSKPV